MIDAALARAEEMRALAAGLVPTFAAFEGTCLDVGRQLAEAMPGLDAAARGLGDIAAALDGDEMKAATHDLEQILSGLRQATQVLDEEGRVLRPLGKRVREMGPQARKMQALVRNVSALVFTLKIESGKLPYQSEEMIAFALTLQDLAERARGALAAYVATQVRLASSLRATAYAHDAFQLRHREAMDSIAEEIAASLEAIASRRESAAGGLREIGDLTREIGERIGECVAGCQIGDTTLQRVQHMAKALDHAAEALVGGSPGQADAPGAALAAGIVDLQRMQSEDAHEEFVRETEKIGASLMALSERTLDLEARSHRVFGLDEGADGSFLHALAEKLAAARTLVEQGVAARRVVDESKREAAEAMSQMQSQTASLEMVAADVTMIGTNASLRSARLGEAGKGITLVAAELRSIGRQIRSGVAQLAETLGQAFELVERLSATDSELGAGHMGQLDQRLVSAVATFGGGGGRILEAQGRLSAETESAQEKLETGTRALFKRRMAQLALGDAARTLAAWCFEMRPRQGAGEDLQPTIDALLRPTYTMAQERRVHDRYAGVAEEAPAAMVEEEDAFML